MLARIVVALGLMLLAIPAVQAASFDCAKAATTFEEAICDDPTLSHTDEVLAVAYATAIGGLSEDAVETMRKAQRQWIDYLADACADEVLPGEVEAKVERATCLQAIYDFRIRGLEKSRMLGGLRFYLKDRFLALPDETGDSWVKVGTKETSFPYLDGTSEEAEAFNAFIDENTKGYDALFDPNAKGGDGEMISSAETNDNSAVITVDAVTRLRISLEVNDYWYGHGAAHGNYSITYRHFLRDQKRELEASDVFAGRSWKKRLADMAFDALKTSLSADGLFVENAGDIAESVIDPTHWNFAGEGLVIRFQPYEVSTYAAGAVSVTIPWAEIDADLAENAYSLMY